MANETVTIDIGVDGSVKIEGHDFTDNECAKVTAVLEAALGDVTNVVKKSAYNRQPTVARGKSAKR